MISTCSLPSHSVMRFSKTSVGQVSPGTDSTARNSREALDLAFHVGFAALDDEVVGVAAGDDVLGL
jgi:hypothetical protein